MPPKKKSRRSSRAASTPSRKAASEPMNLPESIQASVKSDLVSPALIRDSWTDEQEISLFKSMIRWKPVGMHKHFRMIAISENLRNHGYTSPQDGHTRIPGIWEKLGSMYNLEALDAREDSFGEANSDDGSPPNDSFFPFKLPEKDFGTMMFNKRLAPDGHSSPPSLAHQLSNDSSREFRMPSTIEDTEEPRSSPASSRGTKSMRASRRGKSMRSSRLQESAPPSARRGSKASLDNKDQEEDREQNEEDEEGAGDNEDEDQEVVTPTAREGRGGSKARRGRTARGRGVIGRRGRRR
ncbi:hypothetical protein MMC20_001597 [Loxospora ochrophaea]|nr:hypothetical protein [Loxospora ochrophaea]